VRVDLLLLQNRHFHRPWWSYAAGAWQGLCSRKMLPIARSLL
jgi:hypothetical protein